MKYRKFTTLLMLVCILFSLSAGEVRFIAKGLPDSPFLRTEISTSHFRYMYDISMNSDGLFSLTAPPFPFIHTKSFTAGELRFSDIAALLLNPMALNNSSGFTGTRIKRDFTLSGNPSYSGFSFSGNNWDIFAFNPALSRESPSGVGGTLHIKGLGIAIAAVDFVANNGESEIQTEWAEKNNRTLYSIISADSQYRSKDTEFKSSSFVRSSTGDTSITSFSVGSDISLRKRTLRLSLSIRHGQSSDTPEKIAASVFVTGKEGLSIGAEYAGTLSGKPVYGGESQEKTARIGFQGSWRRITIKNTSQIKYTKTGSSNTKTDYRLSYRGDSCAVTAKATHNRQKNSLETWSIEFEDRYCSLSLKNKKLYLTYRFSFTIGEVKLKVTINQLSQITFSAGIIS